MENIDLSKLEYRENEYFEQDGDILYISGFGHLTKSKSILYNGYYYCEKLNYKLTSVKAIKV